MSSLFCVTHIPTDNEFMDAEMADLDGEEGGGWEVEEDDLELPADLVSAVRVFTTSGSFTIE